MNIKQRIVLMISALVFVALGIFVPWHNAGSAVYLRMVEADVPKAPEEFDQSLGYSLIFRPPAQDSRIDIPRLGVEWLCLIALSGSLILCVSNKKE